MRLRMIKLLRDFRANESGTTAIEYAIIASGIAGAIIVVIGTLGSGVTNMWTSVKNAFH
jgi:pilus assembly protein Flp/PilA